MIHTEEQGPWCNWIKILSKSNKTSGKNAINYPGTPTLRTVCNLILPPPSLRYFGRLQVEGKRQAPVRSIERKGNLRLAPAIPSLMGGSADKGSEGYIRPAVLHTPYAGLSCC